MVGERRVLLRVQNLGCGVGWGGGRMAGSTVRWSVGGDSRSVGVAIEVSPNGKYNTH